MRGNFNRKILFGILIIIVILVFVLLVFKGQKIAIVTDKTEYEKKGILKLKIQNYLPRSVCFSSCYPYYLERKNGEWKSYNYQDCPDPDLVQTCIKPGRIKAFEVTLPTIKEGLHRIAVPICENCKVGEEFSETKRFYSNEFEIK